MSSVNTLFECAADCCFGKTIKGVLKSIGNKQSPINIEPRGVRPDPSLSENPLKWSDGDLWCTSLSNTGATWQVNVKARGPNIRGGPLQHDYQLDRLHAHWSKNSETGSEHAVDGKYYAGELHLVHFNAELYKSFSEAAPSEQGLAVLAVFLKEGAPHPQLKGIVDCIPYITYKGMECALQQPLDFVSLIPAGSSYWTYEGSLTTPPWYENVTWIVYKQPIEVSPEQLVVFRKLMSYEERVDPQKSTDGPIDSNVRPIQPLNRRVVREPFGKQPDSVPIS
ncbi:carbonic anhydrase 1 [Dermacentor silvarum]|uniref:carbonic anhydrase 1 n=1 Tax=Dermacentor silvarum TaxID=543639 RepID=UPI00189AC0CF|nr:carbonic anhydrase 1 [Dermacentor silvarum]